MKMQKKRKVRHLLAKLLLVTMLLTNLETGKLAEAWAKSTGKAGSVQVQTSSDAEEPDFEMLLDDVTPGWQSRLLWMPQIRGTLASASVASPSDYGIEIKETQSNLYVSSGYWFNMLATYEGTQKEIEDEYEDSFKLVVVTIDCPAGGSYSDSTGATQFKPAVNDIGKIYSITYVVQYWTEEGTWEDVPDTEITLDYKVVEQEKVDDTHTFTFTRLQDTLLIGKNYDMSALAEISCDDSAADMNNYRIAIQQVVIPSGGSYDDEFGGEGFTPTFADQDLVYEIIYVIERTEDDGATWQLVNGTTETFEYEVKEAQYDLRIEVPASATARVDKEYKYFDENSMAVLASPSELGGVTFRLVVDRVESATIAKTFDLTATGYTPDAADKDQVFQVIYRVVKHYPAESGKADEIVLGSDGQPLEAVTAVTVIGEGVRDTITSDDAKINTLTVSISDGTGPWDGDNGAGNDMDSTNKIIRTYDTITYTLSYTSVTETGDTYKNARFYYEAYLPLTKEEAQFDTDAMGLMDTTPGYMWEVVTDSNGYQTLKWYYEVNESIVDGVAAYAVPSMGTFQVLVKIYAMKNGDFVQPVFTASVAYTEDGEIKTSGTFDQPKEVQADAVKVSAAPAYNVQLKKTSDGYVSAIKVHDFSTGTADALNKTAGSVYGQMQGYGITLQLRQENQKKGMKGVELPSGPITFDLEFSSVYKDGANASHPVDTPLVWSISPHVAGSGTKQRVLPAGMNTSMQGAAPLNGTRTGAFTKPTERIVECWNGGTWTATQDASGVHVTVDHYVINPYWFPNGDTGTSGSTANAYYEFGDDVTVGCFSAGMLYLVVPFGGDSGSSDSNYYATVYPDGGTAGSCQATIKDTNFHAKSVTGQIVDDQDPQYPSQSILTDDIINTSVPLAPPGTMSPYIHYAYSNTSYNRCGIDNINNGGDYNAGTDAQCIGGTLAIQMYIDKRHNGNSESNFLAANQLMKFDDEALEIDISKSITLTFTTGADIKILYGVKPDGTGWNNDTEMNEANEEDLRYYASLDDLAPGEVCVAILLEARYQTDYETYAQQIPGRMAVPFKVKMDTSLAGNVYQTVGVWNAWDRAASTQVMDLHDGVFPSRLDMEVKQVVEVPGTISNLKRENYIKSSYPDGLYTPGGGGEPWYGDSLYIVPYTAKITKSVEQFANSAQTEKKKNYDLSAQQYIADYVLKSYLEFGQEITPPSEFTTNVTITDTLPAGLTYRVDSAILGGTYQPNAIAGQAGMVIGGIGQEPTITYNGDGTQTLVWVIADHLVVEEVPAIHYSCDIDLDSASGTEYLNTASIQTTEDMRLPKPTYGNEADASIKVHAPAMLVARKKADQLFVDAASPFGFTLQWSNRSLEPYKQQVFMDSMPFDGDEKGSSYSGDYAVTELKVSAPTTKTLADYRCYYTLDEAAGDRKASDFIYTDFTGSSCTSGGIAWIQAAIEADGTVPDLVSKKPGAWVILGDLAADETLSTHVSMESDGNDAGDIYVNKISVDAIELKSTTRLVQRQIAGVVWLDANYDGQRQASEKRLGGVLAELLMKQSDGTWAPATNVKGELCAAVTTDAIGSYEFTNLTAGEFKVVFSSGGIQIGEYRATIQKAPGVAASVNSDAEGIYLDSGVLDGGEITGIRMPEADDIASSPYIVNYQDFGLIEAIVPAKTYNDSMQNGDTVKVGDKINYKITYGNDDTIEACDIVITDVLDKGLTVQRNTISNGGVWQPDATGRTGGTITWTLTNIQPKTFSGYVTFTAVVNQKAAGDMKVENSADLKYTYVSRDERTYKVGPLVNPLPEDDQPGVKGHEVTVRKSSDPVGSVVAAGDTITYSLQAKNTGAVTAPYTVIKDYIPEGTTYVDGSVSSEDKARGTYVSDHAYVEWVMEDLQPNEARTVTFSVIVNANPPKQILNVGYYDSPEDNPGEPGEIPDEPTTSTNEILHTTDPDEPIPAALTAEKDADPIPGTKVIGGQDITYTIKIKNNGGEAAENVYVKDAIPEKTTFQSVPADNHGRYHEAGNYISWLIPAIAAGGEAEVSFTVTVDAPTDGSRIVNQAAYDKDWAVDFDGNPTEGDDPGNTTNIVEHPTPPKVNPPDPGKVDGYKVTVNKGADLAGGSLVKTGDTITYSLQVKNSGAETAPYTVVRDYIPEGTTYKAGSVSSQSGAAGAYADGIQPYVEWVVADLKPNETRTVTFAVIVNEDPPVYIYNVGLYDTTEGNPGKPGEIPEEPETPTNEIPHTTDPDNPVPSVLDAVKSADPVPGTTVYGGQDITYTITIKNNGGKTAENVYVKDAVPANTTFKSAASGSQGQYHATGKYVSWLIPSIEAGKEVSVSFTVTVDAPTDGGTIVNQAAYENDWEINDDGTPKEGEEPANTTNIVEHPTPAPKPNLAAVKSSAPVSGTRVYSGNTIVYTITVTNVSETEAKDVYVRDYIPEYMRYVSTTDNGSYNSEGNYVAWNIGTIKSGESASVSFTARVLSTAVNKEVRNYALYEDNWNPENMSDPENRTNEVVHPVFSSGGGGGGGGGTNPTEPTTPGGNSGEPGVPTTPLNPNQVPGGYITTNEREEGIQVRKNVDKTTAEAGNRVTYTITVYNNQDLVTEPMTMVDYLPAYTSFISCTDGTYFADGGYGYVEWHIPALQPYEKKSFKLVVRLDECMPDDYVVENTAYIQLDSIDDEPVPTNRVQTVLAPLGSLARTGDNAGTWMLLLIVVLDGMAIAGIASGRRRKKR